MLQLDQITIARAGQPLLSLPELRVQPGQVATIMGPSGSGKSTLLLWLLGEELPDFHITGRIHLNGSDLTDQPIARRRIGMLFQSVLLFPHMSVEENLLFALPGRPPYSGRRARRQRVASLLEAVGLGARRSAMPNTLSGGEQARIGLLRTLINEPRALLLDEPFSALDSEQRADIRQWTYDRIEHWQVPAILVTHDRDDRPARAQQRGPLLAIENGVAQCSTPA